MDLGGSCGDGESDRFKRFTSDTIQENWLLTGYYRKRKEQSEMTSGSLA